MDERRKLVLKVAGSALLLGGAALAWFLLGGSGKPEPPVAPVAAEGSPAVRRERRDVRREVQAARLRRALETGRTSAEPAAGKPVSPPPRLSLRMPDPALGEDVPPLSGAERSALRRMAAELYSPERLRTALEQRTAAELVREMNSVYSRILGDESHGPALRRALERSGVLLDYGMNILHAQRPEGDEETVRRMVERVNESFAERLDALNADYPFLDIRPVEP